MPALKTYLVMDPIEPNEAHIVEAGSREDALKIYGQRVEYDQLTLQDFMQEAIVVALTPEQREAVQGSDVRPRHERIIEMMDEFCEEYARIEPRSSYDPCIVGIVRRFNDTVLAYSVRAILEMHVREGMTMLEAEDFFDRNTACIWVGEGTPVFVCDDIDDYPGAEPWDVPAHAIVGEESP